MQAVLARCRQLWQETSRTNQIVIVAAMAAALLVGIGFVYWAGSPEYVTLVSNASPENADKIVSQLKEKKVPYHINGNTIDVPASQRDELSIQLAGAGLLESGSQGWGLLEKVPFGQTQAVEQETIRHAHELMMETAIEKLDPVASANVQFSDGDKDEIFDPAKKEGRASVIVRVKPGQDLTKDNVRSIVALVQSGYSNIPTANINVVDGEGHLRWNGADQSDGLSSSDERDAEESRKSEELKRKIQAFIDSITGPGKSTVMVRAVLDLDKRVKKEHEVLPGQTTSKTTTEETLSGGSLNGAPAPAVIQPAGLAANANGATPPSYQSALPNVTVPAGKYSNTNSTSTTSVGTRDTDTVEAPGEIKSAYVVVTLDKNLSPQTTSTLKQQIPILMGKDPTNPIPNVQVSVESAEFDTSARNADKAAAEAAAQAERLNRWLGYGVPIALMLLMLVIFARSLRRTQPVVTRAIAGATRAALPGREGSNVDLIVGEELPAGMSVEEALSGEAKVVPVTHDAGVHTYEVINEQFDANLESILHLAKSKPETVAQLIRSWTLEDKRS